MSSATASSFSYTNFIIVLQHLLTSVIGIVGNVLVLIVYSKKLKDNQTITFFIVHLAITDLACCLFLIPINCYHELYIGHITSDFMCKFHSFLNIINITYSCLLMALVAFERYFCILWPFHRIVTKSRAKLITSFLFLFCVGIGLMGALGIGIYHQTIVIPRNASNMSDVKGILFDEAIMYEEPYISLQHLYNYVERSEESKDQQQLNENNKNTSEILNSSKIKDFGGGSNS
jgi:hypothetical protein